MKKLLCSLQYHWDNTVHKNRMPSVAIDVAKALAWNMDSSPLSGVDSFVPGVMFRCADDRAFYLTWMNGLPNEMSLQAYCAILGRQDAFTATSIPDSFHQKDQAFSKDSWVWFPRLKEDGPTSYTVKYLNSTRAFRWRPNIVGRKQASYSDDLSREETVRALAARIESDCLELGNILEQKIAGETADSP